MSKIGEISAQSVNSILNEALIAYLTIFYFLFLEKKKFNVNDLKSFLNEKYGLKLVVVVQRYLSAVNMENGTPKLSL